MMIENKAVRYAGGSACLLLTILFSIVGLFVFLNNNETNSSPGTAELVVVTPTNTSNASQQMDESPAQPTTSQPVNLTSEPTNMPQLPLEIKLPCEKLGSWTTTVCWNASYVWVADGVVAELEGQPGVLRVQGPDTLSLQSVSGYAENAWNDVLVGVKLWPPMNTDPDRIVVVLCENQINGTCSSGGTFGIRAGGQVEIDPPGSW